MIDYLKMARQQGKADCLDLRSRAKDMDGTAIIAEEEKIPAWEKKDYSNVSPGTPVTDEGQVWQIIQPHDARNYDGRPSMLRALYSLCHTKDPRRAKPWVDPDGTSGMYMKDECYLAKDGTVRRALQDNLVHDAEGYPEGWEVAR